jgi:hypothetical protein
VTSRHGSLFESGLLYFFAPVDLVATRERAFSLKIPDADLIPRRFDSAGPDRKVLF